MWVTSTCLHGLPTTPDEMLDNLLEDLLSLWSHMVVVDVTILGLLEVLDGILGGQAIAAASSATRNC